MLFNLLENTQASNDVEILVEASNEGFRFDNGGGERVITELIKENARVSILADALEISNYEQCKLGEKTISEAVSLQEGFLGTTFDKIKAFLKKAWSRLLEVFNSFKLHILKLTNESKFITEAKKTLDKIKNLSDIEIDGYEYTLDKITPENLHGPVSAAITKLFAISAGKGETIVENVKTAKDKLNDTIVSATGVCQNADDFNEELFKLLRNGEDSKKEIKFNKDGCIKAIESFKKSKNELDRIQKAINSSFSTTIKEVDELKTKASKDGKDLKDDAAKNNSALVNAYSALASAQSTGQTYVSKIITAKIAAIKEEKTQAKSMIMKAISKGRKKDREVNKEMGVSESVFDQIYNSANIL